MKNKTKQVDLAKKLSVKKVKTAKNIVGGTTIKFQPATVPHTNNKGNFPVKANVSEKLKSKKVKTDKTNSITGGASTLPFTRPIQPSPGGGGIGNNNKGNFQVKTKK
jgi:hypothetical protein